MNQELIWLPLAILLYGGVFYLISRAIKLNHAIKKIEAQPDQDYEKYLECIL